MSGTTVIPCSMLSSVRQERLGVRPWSPGQLRHFRATELKSNSCRNSCCLLGHATIDTTINHYIKLDAEKARTAMLATG